MDKDQRKKYVKEQRRKLKNNPEKFLKEEVVRPTLTYWKEEPIHAIGTFVFWVAVMYLAFGFVQAVNNDMIYCESSHEAFNGKLMYVANDFVQFYNEMAIQRQQEYSPLNQIDAEQQVYAFNQEYWLNCSYDVKRWLDEPLVEKTQTLLYGYSKILLKRS